jgi:uncharacterized protein YjbJ (UPF0337 family)
MTMNKLLISLIAGAGIALGGTMAAQAEGMPGPLTKDAYNARTDQAKAQYENDAASCKSMAGNAKDVCELQAKGKRDVAVADAEAAYKNTPEARYDARVARVEATYNVAKEKCDDLSGNPKDVCQKEAAAKEVTGKADAKVDKVATESQQSAMKKTVAAQGDAASDKRDADYGLAVERCGALAGDAKDQCVKSAKARFGKS